MIEVLCMNFQIYLKNIFGKYHQILEIWYRLYMLVHFVAFSKRTEVSCLLASFIFKQVIEVDNTTLQ